METAHFILDVTNHGSHISADLWHTDEAFGSPVASADAETADKAIAMVFSQITVNFDKETIDNE